jgi:hypothetical protein
VYVWRFPVLLFSTFAVTAALLAVSAALLAWRGGVTSRVGRGVLLALVAAMLLASPALVSGTIDALIDQGEGLRKNYVHPSAFVLWAPALLVPAILALLHRLFPPGGAVLRYRAACMATLVALGALNITNWCNPGWCERYGFPFPYSWFSDAILIMNGRNWTAGFSALALLGNATAAALAAVALSRAYRRA